MSTFHLHPVSHPHSPSPPSSTSTATAHSPLPKQYVLRGDYLLPTAHPSDISHVTSLDVNIAQDSSAGPRKYPAPPTGHELMALFPPAPPTAEVRHSTSGFFQRQERAFFAQAGKEILRSWPQQEMASSPSSPPYPRSKPHRTMPGPPPPASPHTAAPTPTAPANNLHAPLVPQPAPLSPPQAHHPHDHHQLPHHPPHPSHPGALALRPPHDDHHHTHPPQHPPPMSAGLSKVEFQAPVDYRDDNGLTGVGPGGPDDSWRRPTPYSDRRRAGKHTRRIIVRT
ncbi:hypothetical protein F5141DRAFT_242629 [Pisolithus sp. B1]|nr:hypothetical protein F5141DRAFT_242629 [Pisolithus sp. B1]